MYRTDIYREVAKQSGLPRATVETAIDRFLLVVADAMKNGEKVTLSGFGVFEPQLRSPRIGRNPHTREPVEIPARILPVFKASQSLKELLADEPPQKASNPTLSKVYKDVYSSKK